ncbi:two-component regulator propeller domain-containing protein [Haliscomenobacter sp.]|uniref:two-component regulator propeller domain-containing protein n=1 Tax=Haliscomenobacter sp. TaxID=2717303 RepID=UPI003593671F
MQVLTFLTILLWGTACNVPGKNDLPKEKEHPKLIKNLGNGNVQCAIQDKAGNLWFGTSDNGLYKYDGKTFTQFLEADGLNSNNISCLLEDKTGNIWVGTRQTGLYLFDGKKFIDYSE